MKRIACWLLGHRLHIWQRFGPHSRSIYCERCQCDWGMNDTVQTVIPWDDDLTKLYQTLGYTVHVRKK